VAVSVATATSRTFRRRRVCVGPFGFGFFCRWVPDEPSVLSLHMKPRSRAKGRLVGVVQGIVFGVVDVEASASDLVGRGFAVQQREPNFTYHQHKIKAYMLSR
jgi:hypothetical protein